jgi:magnesium transporter
MTAVIVDCAVYRKGVRLPSPHSVGMEAAIAAADGDDDFVWVGLHDPTPEELTNAARVFDLHKLAVEDALKAHQRPKLERYDDGFFLVLRTLWYVKDQDAVETGEIHLFVGRKYVVSVRHGEGAGLTETRHELEERASVLGHGPAAVAYAVCDRVVDEYESVASELEDDVDLVEQSVFSDARFHDAERIYSLKRELLEFRRAVSPLREPTSRLAAGRVPGVPADAVPFFRDVHDHVVRVSEHVEALDLLLGGIYEAHLTRVSIRQNDDIRRISAWVAIAAVPTMVAGIYGMNFDHMPELGWRYGYLLVMVVMAAACLLLYRSFKRSGWL